MRTLRGLAGAGVALLWVIVSPLPGTAQIKAPIFEPGETKAPVVKEAKFAGDFKHGNRLVITRKDDTKVVGTLVRVDRKGKRLFLRTEPGEPPVAVPNDEVKMAEKIMVRAAVGGAEAEKTDNQPEIHIMVIRDGTESRVHYFAPTVSPGEKSSLAQLEAAENEMARLQNLAGLNAQYVTEERALQARRRQAQEAYYQAQQVLYINAVTPWFQPYAEGYAGYYPYYPLGGYAGYSSLGSSYGTASINPPDAGNEGVFKANFGVTLAKSASPEAIAKARENLAQAQRNAVYEDGHIVAVAYEEPKK
jgi:hypothetical protein